MLRSRRRWIRLRFAQPRVQSAQRLELPQVHRQRTRCQIRPRRVRGEILRQRPRQVYAAGLGSRAYCCTLCALRKSTKPQSLRLRGEQCNSDPIPSFRAKAEYDFRERKGKRVCQGAGTARRRLQRQLDTDAFRMRAVVHEPSRSHVFDGVTGRLVHR